MTQAQQSKAPLDTIRNKGVFIKLWEQESKNGSFVTMTIGRTYKNDQTGKFGESRSLSQSDLEKLIPIMPTAHKEAAVWNKYYLGQAQQQNQGLGQQPVQVQEVQHQQQDQGAQQQTVQQPVQQPEQTQGLANQRDQVMAGVAPRARAQGQAPDLDRQ